MTLTSNPAHMSEEANQPATRSSELWAGVRATFPLFVGALPFGIIFGAVAITSDISPLGTAAMSAVVFAGSAQFIATGLVASGATVALIVLATFVVNLRHALYAVSLAPHMKHLPQRWLLPLAFWLTDESYVIAIQRYERADRSPHKHWFFFGSALFMYINWQIATYIGIIAGQSIPDPSQWGLDFALIVTFIGMLVPMLKDRPIVLSVLASVLCALLFHSLPNQLGLLVAALAGVLTGIVAEKYLGTQEQRQ